MPQAEQPPQKLTVLVQRLRRTHEQLMDGILPRQDWPQPLEKDVSAANWTRYLLHKAALDRWCKGESEKFILADLRKFRGYELATGRIWRMFQRCIAKNPRTGVINGYWGCVPNWSPRYTPDDPSDTKHGKQLTRLFIRLPRIEAELCKFALGEEKPKPGNSSSAGKETQVPRMRPGKVWKRFTSLCQEENLHLNNEWPYTKGETGRCGKEALRRWYNKKKYLNPSQAARNSMGKEVGDLTARDYGRLDRPPAAKTLRLVYERVELDEHFQDGMFTAFLPLLNGSFKAVATRRLWALAMIESEARLCLSSGMSYGLRYATANVLRLIHNAIVPPKHYSYRLEHPDYVYRKDACFPAELAEFARNRFQTLAMDSDAVHLSISEEQILKQVLGCAIVHDTVGTKEARPDIESFFKLLATLCEWLPSATGNRPDSPARRNPEASAVAFYVSMSWAEEILDMVCRNYNVSANLALGGMTPIQRAQDLASKGRIFRSQVGEFGQSNLHLLLPRYRASLGTQRNPNTNSPVVVRLKYGVYTSKALNRDKDLVLAAERGVWVYVQEDGRFAFVVPDAFPERVYTVALGGRDSREPHTIEMRQMAHAVAHTKVANDIARNPNTILGAVQGLAKAAQDKSALSKLMGGAISFIDRFGHGDVGLIGLSPAQADELLGEAQDLLGTEFFEDDETPGRVLTTSTRERQASPPPVPQSPILAPPARPIWTPWGAGSLDGTTPRT